MQALPSGEGEDLLLWSSIGNGGSLFFAVVEGIGDPRRKYGIGDEESLPPHPFF